MGKAKKVACQVAQGLFGPLHYLQWPLLGLDLQTTSSSSSIIHPNFTSHKRIHIGDASERRPSDNNCQGVPVSPFPGIRRTPKDHSL